MSVLKDNNKVIIKNTIVLYVRMLFLMLISLYTSRILLDSLGVIDYGIYNVVGGIVLWFSFINSSMTNATQRFLTYSLGCECLDKMKKVFCVSMSIHIAIALGVFILAETIGLWFMYTQINIPEDRLNSVFWVYQFSVLSCVIMFTNIPYNATIIAREKMNVYALISIIDILLKLIVVCCLKLSEGDKLTLYAFLILIVQIIIHIIYHIYCNYKFKETIYRFMWNKILFENMTKFALWSLFGNLSSVSVTQGINILLNIFFGPVINAARGIAVQVYQAVLSFALNFQQAMNPQIIKSYAVEDFDRMKSLIFSSSKYSFYLILVFAFPVFICTDLLLDIWLKEVPAYTANFIRLSLLNSLITVTTNPFMIAANATGNIKKYQSVVGGILLLALPLSYVFLRMGFVPEIVYVVNIVVSIFASIFRLIIVQQLIKISLINYLKEVLVRSLFVLFISSLFPCIYNFILPYSNLSSIICCVLSEILLVVTIYFCGLNSQEKTIIGLKIKKITGYYGRYKG